MLPQGLVARVKHSAYIGIATFIGFLASDWGTEHTLSGLRDDVTRNWDSAAGNAVWAVLVANGILTAATAKRNGVGSHPTLNGTKPNPTRDDNPEG